MYYRNLKDRKYRRLRDMENRMEMFKFYLQKKIIENAREVILVNIMDENFVKLMSNKNI